MHLIALHTLLPAPSHDLYPTLCVIAHFFEIAVVVIEVSNKFARLAQLCLQRLGWLGAMAPVGYDPPGRPYGALEVAIDRDSSASGSFRNSVCGASFQCFGIRQAFWVAIYDL